MDREVNPPQHPRNLNRPTNPDSTSSSSSSFSSLSSSPPDFLRDVLSAVKRHRPGTPLSFPLFMFLRISVASGLILSNVVALGRANFPCEVA